MTETYQLLRNGGAEVHIYPAFSLFLCLWNISLTEEKEGAKGQLGSANLLREKLNILSSPINTPLCGDYRGLLGLEIEFI